MKRATHQNNAPVSPKTIKTVRALCQASIELGIIPENEFKQLLKNSKIAPVPEEKANPPPLELLTKKEAAKKLKISVRQLDRLHKDGFIKYVKVGARGKRILNQNLTEFILNGEIQ
jgi:excisionase family DNA binding protein